MKIALLWPGYWPYVRRGTERMVRDIAYYLAGHGHTVDILTSKPGPTQVEHSGNVTIHRLTRKSHPVVDRMLFRRANRVMWFDLQGWQTLPFLLRERYDLVHAFLYIYAPALKLTRWRHGTPVVYHAVMIPPYLDHPLDKHYFRLSVSEKAIPVRVFSRFGVQYMAEEHNVLSHAVPPTVDPQFFQPIRPKNLSRPRILYTADLSDKSKGPHILARAFNHLHRRRPNAILELAGPVGGDRLAMQRLFDLVDPAARASVEVLGTGNVKSVPQLYADAAVTVLPSLNEPFGMVLTESLASGTPVVGSRSGAIPEIVSDPNIGTLFTRTDDDEQSAADLGAAILRSLDLAEESDIAERCQEHARTWTWERVGGQFNELQDLALDRRAPKRAVVI